MGGNFRHRPDRAHALHFHLILTVPPFAYFVTYKCIFVGNVASEKWKNKCHPDATYFDWFLPQ